MKSCKYLTFSDGRMTDLSRSPGYDHGPIIHHWKRNDKQPVVIQISSRINDKYFCWPVEERMKV